MRQLFFPVPGRTLGVNATDVISQAQVDPTNAQYVENVLWTKGDVVFATVNVTGSNDDKADWGTPLPANASSFPSQEQERAARKRATAIGSTARSTTIDDFDDYVVQIGTLAAQFGKPVLLLEGDSHVFRIDHPFTPASPLFGLHPNTPVAPNVTGLLVNGSSSRTEYVRLTINPQAKDGNVFTWVEVPLQ